MNLKLKDVRDVSKTTAHSAKFILYNSLYEHYKNEKNLLNQCIMLEKSLEIQPKDKDLLFKI